MKIDNEIEKNIQNIERDIEVEDKKPKSWLSKMSLFEKSFWIMIILLTIVYASLEVIGYLNINKSEIRQKTAVTEKFIIEYLPTDMVSKNLLKHESVINESFNRSLEDINKKIDSSMDDIFIKVEKNVDKFLDFHYSVKGEYIELFAKASGKLEEKIEEELFGKDFQENFNKMNKNLEKEYTDSLKKYLKDIEEYGLKDVDTSINSDSLALLNANIERNMNIQGGKIAIIAARFTPQIMKIIAARVALKATSKFAAKTGAKLATKSAAAGTGAGLGAVCGPAAVICGPAAAIAAWFATDVAIAEGDEYINREEFKKEIISEINAQKEIFKNEYKKEYFDNAKQLSSEVKKVYSETPILEKKRRIIDKF